jgi:anti-sigma B factor antagonist
MSQSSPPRKQRLKVEEVGDISVVEFLDRRILEDQSIQIIADQLASLVDDQGCRKLLLNFTSVDYMSSAALGKLINLHKKLSAQRGRLIMFGISPQIYEVFAITRLDKVFNIKKDYDEALKSF